MPWRAAQASGAGLDTPAQRLPTPACSPDPLAGAFRLACGASGRLRPRKPRDRNKEIIMHEQSFTIDIDGIPIRVDYRPCYFETLGVAHMAFSSTSQPRRPIPMSETGYRSHFCAPEAVAALGTAEAYATAYCKAQKRKRYGEEASLPDILAAAQPPQPGDQLGLFG
jgi:hypothetical protein